MKVNISLEEGTLKITIRTPSTEQGERRAVNLELDLLRKYSYHQCEPWCRENGETIIQLNRENSDYRAYAVAIGVMRGYAFHKVQEGVWEQKE